MRLEIPAAFHLADHVHEVVVGVAVDLATGGFRLRRICLQSREVFTHLRDGLGFGASKGFGGIGCVHHLLRRRAFRKGNVFFMDDGSFSLAT